MTEVFIALMLALIFTLGVYLVFAPCYRTGLFGGAGLACMLTVVGARLLQIFQHAADPPLTRLSLLFYFGLVMFLSQLVFRIVHEERLARRGGRRSTDPKEASNATT